MSVSFTTYAYNSRNTASSLCCKPYWNVTARASGRRMAIPLPNLGQSGRAGGSAYCSTDWKPDGPLRTDSLPVRTKTSLLSCSLSRTVRITLHSGKILKRLKTSVYPVTATVHACCCCCITHLYVQLDSFDNFTRSIASHDERPRKWKL